MNSPILDTFRDAKYLMLSAAIVISYGMMLLFFDQFLFFVPYFTLYLPSSGYGNLVLDLALSLLTAVVLTVSIRQILLQRQGGGAVRTGMLGIVAALMAGACPCYYLVPLLAVAGAFGGALGAVGTVLNSFQIPIKLGAMLILVVAAYELNKSGVCKVRPSTKNFLQTPSNKLYHLCA